MVSKHGLVAMQGVPFIFLQTHGDTRQHQLLQAQRLQVG